MKSLAEIESLVRSYATTRSVLKEKVSVCEAEIAAIKKQHIAGIKRAAVSASEKEAELRASIEESAGLFVKPRSLTMHGIKFGFQKQKGTIVYQDEPKVIQLIRKYLPDFADRLIKTEDKLLKNGLADVSVSDLKKIGVEIKNSGDEAFVKSVDSDIDKIVNALMKELGENNDNNEPAL